MHRAHSTLKRGEIGQGRLGDIVQRLGGEKALVTGDQHIGEGQEAGEDVILNDLLGQILEEQIRFLFIDVDPQVPELVCSATATGA